jgi:diguanylate cyclase (GGDEF)-like protein
MRRPVRLPTLPRRLQAGLLGSALLLVVLLGAAAALHSQERLEQEQQAIAEAHRHAAEAQRLLLLVADSQLTIRQWMISGRTEERDASRRAGELLAERGRGKVGRLEAALIAHGLPPLGPAFEHVLRVREQAMQLIETRGAEAALEAARHGGGLDASRQLREVLAELVRLQEHEIAAREERQRREQTFGLLALAGAAIAMLAMLLAAVIQVSLRRRAAELARAEMDQRGGEVATLFRMGELLQSSLSPDDIRRVVAHTAEELLPELSGAFYAFNNSRDRLDILGVWGAANLPPHLPEHFGPHDCWALKRGRPHGRGVNDGLRCDHAGDMDTCTLCVPMQARGEVYGVLQFFEGSGARLDGARLELAQALADGVSLALANQALREKLRNQALRDELTGLYNRRFLDETLPRLVSHAERRASPIAVLMLDLDHFKQVNDRYGHAAGDAVLREVGSLLLGRLRRMDVACRYGGEELMVLLPDCSAVDAVVRAQEICAMVRGMRDRADNALPKVTVSIGVAAWPEHGEQMGKVIEAADAALYAAKRAGRDRVMAAEATVPPLIAADPA